MTVLREGLSRYFRKNELDRLASVRVGIIGAGGLGSNVAMLLARSGIRKFTLVDFDVVEASNLNRQAYFPQDVGKNKVQALGAHLLALEPELELDLHCLRVTAENAQPLFSGCPIVVEAVDAAETKIMLYRLFAPLSLLYVTASGLGGFGGTAERAMQTRFPRKNVVAVGDFTSEANRDSPPCAPRVTQAAALQADAVLAFILSGEM